MSGRQPHEVRHVGPYLLGKTIGTGSTGKVKLGVHKDTGLKVAIKIVKKDSLSMKPSLRKKIEREIAVLKLIDNQHVLQLFDVYETDRHLFLVLEHVEGGELFDYLLSKGKLDDAEALKFFQQIVHGVEYCHSHLICHRDLKPENLLLDANKNIKIADFGMASLNKRGSLLQTSCGSPHYASPEVVMGIRYNGMEADVWSCGVILYALVTGRLPFDDNNIKKLLNKVKVGVFHMPSDLPPAVQDLISRMLTVDPEKRIKLSEIKHHDWFTSNGSTVKTVEPVDKSQSGAPIAQTDIDPELLGCLNTLGWGTDEELIEKLSGEDLNLEKAFYRLFERKKQALGPGASKAIFGTSKEDASAIDAAAQEDASRSRTRAITIGHSTPATTGLNRARIEQDRSRSPAPPASPSPMASPRDTPSASPNKESSLKQKLFSRNPFRRLASASHSQSSDVLTAQAGQSGAPSPTPSSSGTSTPLSSSPAVAFTNAPPAGVSTPTASGSVRSAGSGSARSTPPPLVLEDMASPGRRAGSFSGSPSPRSPMSVVKNVEGDSDGANPYGTPRFHRKKFLPEIRASSPILGQSPKTSWFSSVFSTRDLDQSPESTLESNPPLSPPLVPMSPSGGGGPAGSGAGTGSGSGSGSGSGRSPAMMKRRSTTNNFGFLVNKSYEDTVQAIEEWAERAELVIEMSTDESVAMVCKAPEDKVEFKVLIGDVMESSSSQLVKLVRTSGNLISCDTLFERLQTELGGGSAGSGRS